MAAASGGCAQTRPTSTVKTRNYSALFCILWIGGRCSQNDPRCDSPPSTS